MIKLFLITLLCVAMFADSQEDQMNEMGTGLRKASADMAEYARMNQGSPLLMQHAENRGRGGRPGENGEGNGRGNGRGSGKGNRREGGRGNSEQPEEK